MKNILSASFSGLKYPWGYQHLMNITNAFRGYKNNIKSKNIFYYFKIFYKNKAVA